MTEQQIDVDALAALAEKATPGPWRTERYLYTFGSNLRVTWAGDSVNIADDVAPADAEFIAAASPDVVLSLVGRVKTAEGRAERASDTNLTEQIACVLTQSGEMGSRDPDVARIAAAIVEQIIPKVRAEAWDEGWAAAGAWQIAAPGTPYPWNPYREKGEA